jgi:hypothetical protein
MLGQEVTNEGSREAFDQLVLFMVATVVQADGQNSERWIFC